MPQQQIDLTLQTREAAVVPASWSADDNGVDVVWTTGARRRTYDWMTDQVFDEELVVDADSVDMTRFEAGVVQVIDGHRVHEGTSTILGIAKRGWIEGGQGHARVVFRTSTPELAAIANDVQAGLLRAMSFGYSVQRYEIIRAQDRTDGGTVPLYRATRWTPQELSFVAVPADPNAAPRSQQSSHPCEIVRADAQPSQEPSMPQTINTEAPVTPAAGAPVADAIRADALIQSAADITEMCARHGVPQLAASLIRSGATVDKARESVLNELALRDAAQGGHVNVRSIQTGRDETETRLKGLEEALNHRLDSRSAITDNGRQYRSLSLLEMGRDYLQSRGIDTRGMDRMRLATEMLHFRSAGMHTTSDFSNLMSSVANKRLRAAYDQNPGTYAMWARRAPNAPDFKNIQVTALSGAPDLLRTNEHGEFTYGTMRDGAETYSVVTFGRIVSLTRQAIVNDDLRAFDRLVSAYGAAARRLENRTVYSILTANANMADGVALFSAVSGARTQANVTTGAGSALQLSALATARAAMRVMRGLNGEELNVTPSYLIVPAALEQTAYQLTSANYVPATQAAINEFRAGGRTALEPIVEPLLDTTSATQWYLAANSAQIDTVEYCYLDGAEGPVIESDVGFEVDGVSYKCRLDFGAKAIDFRGLLRAAGA
jgi:hypothetical protein